jgi:NitT/TauT family transport system substrate-binding protein
MWTVRGAYLAKNRAALVDMLEDELRGLHWFLDPANRPAAIQLLAQFSKQPAERLEPWVLDHHDYYRDPDGMPNLEATQKNIDTQKELGFLKTDFDVQKYADLSLVKEAAARLK